MNPWSAARNILAVRLDNIGDIIMLGPALRALKESAPDARITLLASPAGATGARLLPWVDDVLVWRAVWQDLGHLEFDPARELELIEVLRRRQFDAALIFTSFSQTPHVPGYVCYLAGIPLRAGESKEFGGASLSTELRVSADDDSLHQVERNLRLVERLGFPVRERDLEIRISSEERAAVPRILREAGIDPDLPFVIVHPGASARARRYPAERFGAVADLIVREGRQVLVLGTARETDLLATVAAHAPRARILVGGTSVAEYAALVESAALVICNDSLPMHLADATLTPVLVLYSGTDYESQWRPRRTMSRLLRRETACAPCYLFDCPIGLPCLDFEPREVVALALAMLEARVAA
jgi:ADP-heptose:LPS heptosyltransferase